MTTLTDFELFHYLPVLLFALVTITPITAILAYFVAKYVPGWVVLVTITLLIIIALI